MNEWEIRHTDGSALKDEEGNYIVVKSLEYNGSWMGECFVTTSLKSPAPILFEIGDYLIYRGEKFEINYDPGKIKQARRGEYGEAFVYENVKFNAKQDELARTEFLDIVLHDNQIHYTSLTKFSFYISSLDDLLDRIQANLNEQWGNGEWKLYSRNRLRSEQRGCDVAVWDKVYGTGIADNVIESTSITVDNLNCWNTLALVNSQFDVNFITRDRNVFVGTAGLPTSHIFEYGKGRGLYQIEQNADSEQSITTRLRAYGSTKNIPNRYYATLNLQVFGTITKITTKRTGQYNYTAFELDLPFKKFYFFNELTKHSLTGEATYYAKIKIKNEVVNARISNRDGKTYIYSEYDLNSVDPDDNKDLVAMQRFVNVVNVGERVYFVSGVKKDSFPVTNKDYATDNLPNNMAIDRLMLPGFPNKSLKQWWDEQSEDTKKRIYQGDKTHLFSENKYRPYIDSPNVRKIGVRPNSVYFDNKDIQKGIEEIYPSIEKMEINGVRIDEVLHAKQIEDNGVFKDGATIPNFSIFLKKEIDFNINDLLRNSTEQPYICMKNGMCGGRQFKIASARKLDNGSWELTCERVLDDSLNLYFPYNDFQIKPNDNFVLIGIPLPDSYVEAASIKLLKYALTFLDKNDYTRYIYSPKIDEVYMQRQHDLAIADTTGLTASIHDTIKEGDIMQFEDTDLHIDGKVSIDQLTIREADGKIPTYEITLREDKSVGTIQKLQEKINSLESGNGGTVSGEGGNNLTVPQLQRLIETYGGKNFISKVFPDTAQDVITFLKGISFNNGGIDGEGNALLKAIQTLGFERTINGFGVWLDEKGRAHGQIDYLEVIGKAIFRSLQIDEYKHIGGNIVLSGANAIIEKVVPVAGGWKCYLHTDDGDKAITNDWEPGDQALCQTFNIKAGVYENVSNRCYWRVVVEVGQKTATEEAYIVITDDDTYCDKSVDNDEPKAGDNIVLCGHNTLWDIANGIDPTLHRNRMNVTMITTSKEEGGTIEVYRNIHDFSLSKGNAIFHLSSDKIYMNSQRFEWISADGERIPNVIYRGDWAPGTVAARYEAWYYGGGTWLSLEDNNTDEPTEQSPKWKKYASKGDTGETALTLVCTPATLSFETNRDGEIENTTQRKVQVVLYEGQTAVTPTSTTVTPYNCYARLVEQNIVVDGISPNQWSGHIAITATYKGQTRTARVEFVVSAQKWNEAKFEANQKQFQSIIAQNKADKQGLEQKISTIKQTADNIQLEVRQQTFSGVNLLKGASLRPLNLLNLQRAQYVTIVKNPSVAHFDNPYLSISRHGATQDEWNGCKFPIVTIQGGKTYTLSMFVRIYGSDQPYIEIKRSKSKDMSAPKTSYPNIPSTYGQWKPYSHTFNIEEGYNYLQIFIGCTRNGEVYISEIQLEEGTKATSWKDPDVVDSIERTGIDLTNGTVSVEAANFEIKHNGEKPFVVSKGKALLGGWVFDKGKLFSQCGDLNGSPSTDYGNTNFNPDIVLDPINGYMSGVGSFRKKMLVVTQQNIAKYAIINSSGDYVFMAGKISAIATFKGAFDRDIFITLPGSGGYLGAGDFEIARTLIGETIAIYNQSTSYINIWGAGTSIDVLPNNFAALEVKISVHPQTGKETYYNNNWIRGEMLV